MPKSGLNQTALGATRGVAEIMFRQRDGLLADAEAGEDATEQIIGAKFAGDLA